LSELDTWAARQIENPWLAFGGEDSPASVDPSVLTENIGADRIEATGMGIKNLERVMGYIVEATTQLGRDFSLLDKTYSNLLEQRTIWLSSVVKMVGGVEETRILAGRGGQQFHRVPVAEQRAAVNFVLENLRSQPALMPVDVLDQIEPWASTRDFMYEQRKLLEELLSPYRHQQLVDGEILDPEDAYSVMVFIGDVQSGLFSEFEEEMTIVDPQRRSLQRYYLAILQDQLSVSALYADTRGAIRWHLEQLYAELERAELTSVDTSTLAHIADLQMEIEEILDIAEQRWPQ
jgi:hypothetical protein